MAPPVGHIPPADNIHWATPEDILEPVFGTLGKVDLDPCSNAGSIVRAGTNWTLPAIDGLKETWAPYSDIFVNPPYGRVYMHNATRIVISTKQYRELELHQRADYTPSTIGDWVRKASDLVSNASVTEHHVLMLIPAAVDTKPWQDIIFKDVKKERAYVCLIRGRITFIGAKTGCAMSMSMVYWTNVDSKVNKFMKNFNQLGTII